MIIKNISPTELLESGLALIPVPVGLKGPNKKDWNHSENCIKSTKEVQKLDGKNIGLAHAFCNPSPTCAIDIDNLVESREWLFSRGVNLNQLINHKKSVVILSGRKNSQKLLYRLPKDIGLLLSTQFKDSQNKVFLEFRCATANGKTVQDILPPSIHPSGTQYKWIGEGSPLDIPIIPDALLKIWQEQNENKVIFTQKTHPFYKFQSPETPREIARVNSMLEFIDADCSREIWLGIVFGLLSTSWVCSYQLAEDWSKTAPHRFNKEDFDILVASYNPIINGGFTLGTVFYYARLGGWNG
ncbi:MAG: bifunctional DNA primase/polymerase [Gammaproteobacteria bacterium]